MASNWSNTLVQFLSDATNGEQDIPAIAVQSAEQRTVAEGKAFITYVNNDSLASNGHQYVYFKTPVDKQMLLSVSSVTMVESGVNPNKSALSRFNIYEAPTVTNVGTGTKVVTANLNREIMTSPEFTITADPTITTEGTQITKGLILSGTSTVRDAMHLKADTEYLLDVENISSVAVVLSWNFMLYQLDS